MIKRRFYMSIELIGKNNNTISATILPFVKWAGGKRQLLKKILSKVPSEFSTYYEPFVGGGAVLFGLQQKNSVINDINSHLMHAYKIIRASPNELMTLLDTYDEIKLSQELYKEFRDKYNSHIKENVYNIETAALFIYLNKHGFNGLFRVNSKGLFNVPWNKKEYVASYSKENILQVSHFLQTVKITNEDFVASVQNAEKEDFVFFDSPYAPLNSTSFAAYDKSGFKLEDHQRLAALFKLLDTKGVYCMLTNHNTELINNLYQGYHIEEVNVRRSINSDASKRTGKELIITNY